MTSVDLVTLVVRWQDDLAGEGPAAVGLVRRGEDVEVPLAVPADPDVAVRSPEHALGAVGSAWLTDVRKEPDALDAVIDPADPVHIEVESVLIARDQRTADRRLKVCRDEDIVASAVWRGAGRDPEGLEAQRDFHDLVELVGGNHDPALLVAVALGHGSQVRRCHRTHVSSFLHLYLFRPYQQTLCLPVRNSLLWHRKRCLSMIIYPHLQYLPFQRYGV